MLVYILITFLISVSPFGESRVGIPYGVINELPVLTAFLVGLVGNLLVFPLFFKFIDWANHLFWHYKWYRKVAIYLSKRAKSKTRKNLEKYGFWGLMVFVMIPLPVTGSYMGTLAAYIFRMDYKKSLLAISTGVTISCTLIAAGIAFGIHVF